MVRLSLHRPETAVLPRHPLFRARDIKRVCEAELVVWIVVAGEVGKDSEPLLHSETALIMVDNYRNSILTSARPPTQSAPLIYAPPIRTKLGEPWLLLYILRDVDGLPCIVLMRPLAPRALFVTVVSDLAISFLELLEDDRCFDTVWRTPC